MCDLTKQSKKQQYRRAGLSKVAVALLLPLPFLILETVWLQMLVVFVDCFVIGSGIRDLVLASRMSDERG